ncbi:MAG: transcriptional regulator, partial [Kineosporiaceae bacterium]
GRLDVLGTNRLGRALFSPLHLSPVVADAPGGPVNHARFAFLDPRADDFFTDWHTVAADIVAVLRTEAGRSPRDRTLTGLVGELSTRSEAFRTRWAAHDVRLHRTGTKRFRHPVVGDLTLTYEVLDLTADPGQALVVYGAEPGTPSADGLSLLATWTATPRQEDEGAQERPWS